MIERRWSVLLRKAYDPFISGIRLQARQPSGFVRRLAGDTDRIPYEEGVGAACERRAQAGPSTPSSAGAVVVVVVDDAEHRGDVLDSGHLLYARDQVGCRLVAGHRSRQ